ncbi:hypothetical protein GCM10025771_14900 [Niveibacterium umoris]|uniref:HD domain-containing protein n=1 Tax=Niveibacterium umoris TaxID=1193620 RepID=A0A840BMZ3_9RHOO|nr:hypothetical protein [Niveibacterium umoris]
MADVLDGAALVDAAQAFATLAHQQVGQLRKYTGQPYSEHLRRVAEIVASVTDDPAMQAAAWLHDVVEDTPVTIEEIGRTFGPAVRELVDALTDVSRSQDGNRAARKAIDRAHLARAPARAQTVKLADLIDNCQDICKHDAGFGRLFLSEMSDLLDVLTEADPKLMQRARKTLEKWRTRVGGAGLPEPDKDPAATELLALPRAHRTLAMFARFFTAADIAEPLLSFDTGTAVATADPAGAPEILGVRERGVVRGYVRPDPAATGTFGDGMQAFAPSQQLAADATLSEVVLALTRHDHVFILEHDQVTSFVGRRQMQGPEVRMWLFGIITGLELMVTEGIRSRGQSLDWSALIGPARLEKARAMQAMRAEAGRPAALLDCLQLSDKLRIALSIDDTPRAVIRGNSKAESQRLIRDLENLRNGLAHAQDIVSHDWAQIARLARRLEELARAL